MSPTEPHRIRPIGGRDITYCRHPHRGRQSRKTQPSGHSHDHEGRHHRRCRAAAPSPNSHSAIKWRQSKQERDQNAAAGCCPATTTADSHYLPSVSHYRSRSKGPTARRNEVTTTSALLPLVPPTSAGSTHNALKEGLGRRSTAIARSQRDLGFSLEMPRRSPPPARHATQQQEIGRAHV